MLGAQIDEYVVPQLPMFNSRNVGPCADDAVGTGEGCCDGGNGQNGGGGSGSANLGNASILLHSGQEMRQETDLYLSGLDSAIDLKVMRRHTTRRDEASSIFGPGWAFNYDHVFEVIPSSNDLLFNGFGREDKLTYKGLVDSVPVFEGTQGRLDVATYDALNDKLTVRRPGGTRMVFHVFSEGAGLPLEGFLHEIISPDGNKIILNFDSMSGTGKLTHITDSYKRRIDLTYDTVHTDLVAEIKDFSNRKVTYTYDGDKDLIAVRAPVATGPDAPPAGKVQTMQYTYYKQSEPVLAHALTGIYYPNENSAGYIPSVAPVDPRLTWTYITDTQDDFYGWVETHTIGNTSVGADLAAGGTFDYDYEEITVVGVPGINDPLVKTTVTDRRGTKITTEFNFLGQMLKESFDATTLDIRPSGSPTNFDREFTYTDDGLLLTSKDPLGVQVSVTYPDPQHNPAPLRSNMGNVIKKRITPDSTRFSDPNQPYIEINTTYDPVFNRPYKVTDARGYTTTYIPDYAENLTAAKGTLAPQLGILPADLVAQWNSSYSQVVDEAGDVNDDGASVPQLCGNVIRIEHPDVSLPSQYTLLDSNLLTLSATQTAHEIFQYNVFGQIVYHEDAEENIHKRSYYGEDDPDGDGNIDVAGGSQTEGGYLKETITDDDPGAGQGGGRDSGRNPTPIEKTAKYEYTAKGTYPANPRGIPTAVEDGRGIWMYFYVNELDQIVEVKKAAAITGTPPGLTAYGYTKTIFRDLNNNVEAESVQNAAALDGGTTAIDTNWTYDILDFKRSEVLDAGGTDVTTKNTTTTYKYDASTNLIERVRGFGTGDASKDEWVYDKRNIMYKQTRGADVPAMASETTTEIDAVGNITAKVDASADKVEMVYDAYNRLLEIKDRESQPTSYAYDKASNVVNKKRKGVIGALEPNEVLQGETTFHFDERNRLFRKDDHLFHISTFTVGTLPLDDGALLPGDGLITEIYIRDRLNRVVGHIDADKDPTVVNWDGAGRKMCVTDPANNKKKYVYDLNDNVTKVKEEECSALISQDEEFETMFEYDSLNRRKKLTEPNGQVTTFEYDSRDNMKRSEDHLGNHVEYPRDRLNRDLGKVTYLSANGLSATASSNIGKIEVANEWDFLHRLHKQVDDKANETVYDWDPLDRKTQTTYGDGETESWIYNTDSEVLTHTNQMGSVATWVHDKKGRPTSVSVVNPGSSGIIGSTYRSFGYDAFDRLWGHFDGNGPMGTDDVLVIDWRDSLGRKIREAQKVSTAAPLVMEYECQGANRLVSQKYPNGRVVKRSYNNLDLLFEIREGVGNGLIARNRYVGPWRRAECEYGNGTKLTKVDPTANQTVWDGTGTKDDYGYDANRRHIRHEWKLGANTITSYLNTYNGTNELGTNRRITEEREHWASETDTYVFDSAYRMKSFLRNGNIQSSRTLDDADKMTAFDDEGTQMSPGVDTDPLEDGLNQYTTFGGNTRTYSDNGNLVDEGQGKTYKYDSTNRLVEAWSGSTLMGWYVYDALGRRLAICRQTLTNYFQLAHFGNQVCEERNLGTGLILRQYVDGAGIDEHVQLIDYDSEGDPVYYYHCNSQGSVGAMTDVNGAVVEYYKYKWLGMPMVFKPDQTPLVYPTTGNLYMFQGRYLDIESAKYYFRSRHYDPATGEHLQIDRIGLWAHGNGNGYSAFDEDPWNIEDPYGQSPFSILAKHLVKLGLRKGMKEFAEKELKDYFKKKLSKKAMQKLGDDIVAILDTLDSAWWEICIEFVPVAGDLYGGGRLAVKANKAWEKLDKLKKKFKAIEKLEGLADKAAQGGRKARNALESMANKAGLSVVSGGKHLTVRDATGSVITQIPHTPKPGTARHAARAILRAAGL